MIDGEGENDEHQMAFHLDFAVNRHEHSAEFLIKSFTEAFDHGAGIIEPVVRVGRAINFVCATCSPHLAFAS